MNTFWKINTVKGLLMLYRNTNFHYVVNTLFQNSTYLTDIFVLWLGDSRKSDVCPILQSTQAS